MKIDTDHCPWALRHLQWVAFDLTLTGPVYGWGATEEAAIDHLLQQIGAYT